MNITVIPLISVDFDFNCFVKTYEKLFEEKKEFNDRLKLIKESCKILNDLNIDSKTNFFIEHFCKKFSLSESLFHETILKLEEKEQITADIIIDDDGIRVHGKDWYHISNFSIIPQYLIRDDQSVNWIIKLQRRDENPIYIKVNNDEWCSAKKLQRVLIKEQYVLKCGDPELRILQEHLGRVNLAEKVTQLGYNSKSNAYFFSNVAIYNNEVIVPDEFGIVNFNDKNYYMPYVNNKPFKNCQRFIYTDNDVSFNSWSTLFIQAYQESAILPIACFISSLFRDISFREFRRAPIFYIKGQRGTSKSSLAQHLTACSGFAQELISLKSPNTVKALPRILAQTSNSLAWFDEWSSNLNYETTDYLQSSFDGGGYAKADYTSGIETKTTDILSNIITTSNTIIDNPILASRVILHIMNKHLPPEQRNAHLQLLELEKKGLSCVSIDIIQYRQLIEDNYLKTFDEIFNLLMNHLKHLNVDNRIVENICILITPMYILLKNNKITINKDPKYYFKLFNLALINVTTQNSVLFSNSDVFLFWATIQQLIDNNQIKKGVDYKIRNLLSENKEIIENAGIVIRYNRIYKFYEAALKNKALLAHELLEQLKNDDTFICKIDSFSFYAAPDETANTGEKHKTTVGFQFDVNRLISKYSINF